MKCLIAERYYRFLEGHFWLVRPLLLPRFQIFLDQPRDLLPSKRFGLYHEVVDVPIRAKNYRLKYIKFREQNRLKTVSIRRNRFDCRDHKLTCAATAALAALWSKSLSAQ